MGGLGKALRAASAKEIKDRKNYRDKEGTAFQAITARTKAQRQERSHGVRGIWCRDRQGRGVLEMGPWMLGTGRGTRGNSGV